MRKARGIVVGIMVAAAAVLGFVSTSFSQTGGCVLQEFAQPSFALKQCVFSFHSNCYDCWYSDHVNDGYQHCAESPDGTIQYCKFHEEMPTVVEVE